MKITCHLAIPNYKKNMQGFDRHYHCCSRFTLSSRHGFKKYYITHQLAQIDMGITNNAIYYVEANPHLKKKEGVRRSFVEDIADHLMDAKHIDWEGIYGHSTLDLDSGTTGTPGKDSDDEDILNHLGVTNLAAPHFSPSKEMSIDICVSCSPFSQEFMDLHESRYLKKKKATSVEHQVLNNQIGKRFKNCQVCKFEGCHIVMKHNTYCKTHCVHLCIVRHTPSHKTEQKEIDDNPVTDFLWVCTNTSLTC
jgi:hypothetical protein